MKLQVRKIISWKVKLLCWNQEPCFTDLDSEHLAPVTFLRHRQQNPSGILASVEHVHISTTSVALHLTPKQSHVLQELDNHCLVTEQAREKYLVRTNVFPQHRTSVWWRRQVGHPFRLSSYSATTSLIFFTIVLCKADARYNKHCFTARRKAGRPLQGMCCTAGGT